MIELAKHLLELRKKFQPGPVQMVVHDNRRIEDSYVLMINDKGKAIFDSINATTNCMEDVGEGQYVDREAVNNFSYLEALINNAEELLNFIIEGNK